jgi:NADPH:quinone reductase-like Zn-dependent oxidoreductase
MKANYITRHGGPEVFEYGHLPDPLADPGQVVVDIHAASVNGADWKVREGAYSPLTEFPYILGRDFSGTISALGQGVDDFSVGDEVFGVCAAGQEGTYAEKITMDASIIAAKPDTLSHETTVALALTSLTALVAVEETLKLQPGEKILIQGGAGGVASFAIQAAKHIGAHVVTTTSTQNIDYVKSLGADEVINYQEADFTKIISECDAAFDTVGGEVAIRTFDVLKSGGRAAFIASGGKAPTSPRDDVISLRPAVGRDRKYLERMLNLVKLGAVRPPQIKTYPLQQAADAHRVSEGRHFRGKLILIIR